MAEGPVVPQTRAKERRSLKRIFGLDRSGPPPPQTRSGRPLNPWTIPNLIVFLRLALIPVFVLMVFTADDGKSVVAAFLYAALAWSDYADGIVARLTGQFSRLGTLLDPFADRLLAFSGLFVCFYFDLLPRWLLAIAIVRELAMLPLSELALKKGVEIVVNWPGRLAVWPLFAAIFAALLDMRTAGTVCLYAGVALSLIATVLYAKRALTELKRKKAVTPSG